MKPHLLLTLTLLLPISCKRSETTTKATTPPSQSTPHTPPHPDTDPKTIHLRYHISYAKMEERTSIHTVENDPFADIAIKPSIMQPSKLLARTGLPLPEGTTITHNGRYLFLTAPPAYHQQVAALLGVKGTPHQQ